MEFFDRFATGELLTLVSTQLGVVRDVVVGNTSRDRGLRAVLEAVGSVAILVWLSARMGPPMAAVIVLSGVVAARHSRRLKALFASDARQVSQMVSVAGEALGAIKTGESQERRGGPNARLASTCTRAPPALPVGTLPPLDCSAVRTCAGEGLEQARFGAYVEASFDTGLRALGAKATQEVLIRGSIHLSLLLVSGASIRLRARSGPGGLRSVREPSAPPSVPEALRCGGLPRLPGPNAGACTPQRHRLHLLTVLRDPGRGQHARRSPVSACVQSTALNDAGLHEMSIHDKGLYLSPRASPAQEGQRRDRADPGGAGKRIA